MSRNLDFIIFGATGFSGQIAVQDAVDTLKPYKWGIAGRNKKKLEDVLKNVGKQINQNLEDIPIIIADVDDEKSINEMVKQSKVLLNCCGPFELWGEIVVKSCIDNGTHHVDISVEPQYIDNMQLKYHQLAKEKQVYVVSNCAFESIPAEMGMVYAEKQFEGTINSTEMYLTNTFKNRDKNCKAVMNFGTWNSIVYSIKNGIKLIRRQRKMNNQLKCPKLRPTLRMKAYIRKPSFSESYFVPMPIGDCSVIERSQRRLYEFEAKRPIQIKTYIGLPSFFITLLLTLYVGLLGLLAFLPFVYKILLKYPEFFSFGWFSRDGSPVCNQEGHHYTMIFKSKGWSKGQNLDTPPNKKQLTKVLGVNGYAITSVGLLLSGKMILDESSKMPEKGGVLPPGAAFYRTSLLEELSKHKKGLKFEMVEETVR